jgi:AcrR family transcriptional regulator
VVDVTVATDARRGRPPRRDINGIATRERLLVAAAASCVEHGFDGVTLNDIAGRAEVSGPAIYNHFASKVELMVAAAQLALRKLGRESTPTTPRSVVDTYLSDEFATTRRFLVELHLASYRHPELAQLLGAWQAERAAQLAVEWTSGPAATRPERTTALFAFLLGLCQIDSLSGLGVAPRDVRRQAHAMVDVLFPSPESAADSAAAVTRTV